MTKTNKKGFTLVELIIVIAILAILIAALAPALIKYIEKSRIKKDTSSLDNVYTTLKAALDDEDLYKVNTAGKWAALSSLATGDTAVGALYDELFGNATKNITGTLDTKYAAADPKDVFKSKAAAGMKVYVAIQDGKVAVCLAKQENPTAVETAFGDNGIVGDFTPSGENLFSGTFA